MQNNNKTQFIATKSTKSKADKASISSIIDDAPLFAGLDGYILRPAVKVRTGASTTGKVKEIIGHINEKKRVVTQQKKQVNNDNCQPQHVPKMQKQLSSEADAILLSVSEMCSLLKISRATLFRMDKSGQLPGRIKLGGSVRFHRETVETWLQSLINTCPAP